MLNVRYILAACALLGFSTAHSTVVVVPHVSVVAPHVSVPTVHVSPPVAPKAVVTRPVIVPVVVHPVPQPAKKCDVNDKTCK